MKQQTLDYRWNLYSKPIPFAVFQQICRKHSYRFQIALRFAPRKTLRKGAEASVGLGAISPLRPYKIRTEQGMENRLTFDSEKYSPRIYGTFLQGRSNPLIKRFAAVAVFRGHRGIEFRATGIHDRHSQDD